MATQFFKRILPSQVQENIGNNVRVVGTLSKTENDILFIACNDGTSVEAVCPGVLLDNGTILEIVGNVNEEGKIQASFICPFTEFGKTIHTIYFNYFFNYFLNIFFRYCNIRRGYKDCTEVR